MLRLDRTCLHTPLPAAASAYAAAAHTRRDPHTPPGAVLREMVAAACGLHPDHIAVGAGTPQLLDELLRLLAHGAVLAPSPTSQHLPRLVARSRSHLRTVPMIDHRPDIDALLAAITPNTSVILLSHPDRITGAVLMEHEWAHLLDGLPDYVTLIVDEASRDFVVDPAVPDLLNRARQQPNVVLVRTFTTAHGLAEHPVSYSLTTPSLAGVLRTAALPQLLPYPVEAAAQASFAAVTELATRRGYIGYLRAYLRSALHQIGLACPTSHSNFVFVSAAEPDRLAHAAQTHDISVRTVPAAGVRITATGESATDRVIEAFRSITGTAVTTPPSQAPAS